ncbi:hypothetical protein [Streptomyces sp. TR06-5]
MSTDSTTPEATTTEEAAAEEEPTPTAGDGPEESRHQTTAPAD